MKSILKKIIGTLAVVLLTAISVYAQVPQGFNFQAVARGANGEVLADQALGVQVSIIKGTEDGNPLYQEAHTITTNPLGLIQIVIGEGTPGDGQTFSAIDFGNDNYFVRLAIDPAGGSEYADLGTTRLLSVPYALVAQKAVEGGGATATEINLNTANADSSFVINLEGNKQAKPFQVFSRSTSDNRAIWGEAVTEASNTGSQRGVLGFSNGLGTGQQVGVFGSAINFDGTGGDRKGIYGQAASKGKYNYGVQGLAAGDGNGESETDPANGDFGSFNLGGYFQAYGNLNGNTGVHGVTSGSNGNLRNFGLIGTSRTSASGSNIGLRAEAFNSSSDNTALDGEASGTTKNLGLRLNVFNGSSNVGMEVNADTAAILNGTSIINGDLTVNGTINGGGVGGGSAITEYNLDTAVGDTSFIINATGSNSISGALKVRSETDGQNRGVDSRISTISGNESAQLGIYGRADGEGSGEHYGLYGLALSSGGGNNFGTYNIAEGIGKFNFGVYGIARGAGSGEIVAIGNETAGNVGSVNIAGGFYPRDNLNANVGVDVAVGGSAGERVNLGAEFRVNTTATGLNSGVQTIVNGSSTLNRGFWGLVDGDNNNVGMDLTVNGGTSNIGLIVNASTAAELNGNVFVNGDLNYSGALNNTSDRNLKENIQPLENGVSTIMKLRPTSYNFRGDGEYKGLKLSRGLHYGLIAQEVEEVLPSLVKDNKHTYLESAEGAGPNNPEEKTEVKSMDYKSMNYTELIPVLIKAVQEQQVEIEKLRKQIESLKKDK